LSTIYACIVTPKICSGLTFFLFSNDNYISVLHNIFWMNIVLFMLAWFGNELALDQYMCIICNTQYNNYYWLTRYNDWSKWFYISNFSPFINPIFMSMGEGWKAIKKLSWMWKILLEAQIRDMGGKALNVKIQLIVYSLQDNNQLYWWLLIKKNISIDNNIFACKL